MAAGEMLSQAEYARITKAVVRKTFINYLLTPRQTRMEMHPITIILYAHMKEKAGSGCLQMEVPENLTVGELKKRLKHDYPALGPQLANVVVLINKHNIFLDEDVIPLNAEVTFLPPIAGG